jgi:hypothetical protein
VSLARSGNHDGDSGNERCGDEEEEPEDEKVNSAISSASFQR